MDIGNVHDFVSISAAIMENSENKQQKKRPMTRALNKKRKDTPVAEEEEQGPKKRRIDEETKEEKKPAVAQESKAETGPWHTYNDDAPLTFVNEGPHLLAGTALFKKADFVSAEADMSETKYVQSGVVINIRKEGDVYNYDRIRVPFKTQKRATEFLCALVRILTSRDDSTLTI
jgi:hypothetical protein